MAPYRVHFAHDVEQERIDVVVQCLKSCEANTQRRVSVRGGDGARTLWSKNSLARKHRFCHQQHHNI